MGARKLGSYCTLKAGKARRGYIGATPAGWLAADDGVGGGEATERPDPSRPAAPPATAGGARGNRQAPGLVILGSHDASLMAEPAPADGKIALDEHGPYALERT